MTDLSSPSVPRPAATVMVARAGETGLEVFMVRRPRASAFVPDCYVFPGGAVRADDRLDPAAARELGLDPAALRARLVALGDPFAEPEEGGPALWSAALRELFEEAGILLADERDAAGGSAGPARVERLAGRRQAVQSGQLSFGALVIAERLRLHADGLIYFSRWITPRGSPRRFDTRFFVAELPAGQEAEHCQIETVEGLWINPRTALDRSARGEFPLVFVTREHLKRLAEFETPETLLAFTRTKPIRVMEAQMRGQQPYLTEEQQRWW